MIYALRFLLLICILVVSIFPLFAENNLNLLQVIDSGDRMFGRTYQLDETHYLSCFSNTLRVYQIANDQIVLISEVVEKDFLIPAKEMIGNRVYALAEGDGVYVYQITPNFQIDFQHLIPVNPLNEDHHYSLDVLGMKMLVQSISYPGSGEQNPVCYIDTYNIADELQPVHLNRYWLPDNDSLFGAVQCANGYYLSTFNGSVYYSEDLITYSAPFQLPGDNGNNHIQTSFEHEGKVFFMGLNGNQPLLWRCSVNVDNSLSLDWVQNLPGYWFCGISFEADRVVLLTSNVVEESYVIFYIDNGETWQQTSSLVIPRTDQYFPTSGGYLGIQSNAVHRFNTNFGGYVPIYQNENKYIEEVIMNRYVVLTSSPSMSLAQVFDLQTGTWLNLSSSFTLNWFTNRWNKTEIILGNGYSCQLIGFQNNGSYTSTTFDLGLGSNFFSSSESKWGNRILSQISWNPNTVIRLFSYDGGAVTARSTWTFPFYAPGVEFYSPDHFYLNQRELGNEFLHFYRINPDHSITLVGSIPAYEPYRIYQGQNFIITSGSESCVINVSDPDSPYLVSTFSLTGQPWKNISYNGNGHFLFTGISRMTKAYVMNAQGEVLTSFYAHLPWYIGENRFVLYNNMNFCIMDHPDIVGIEDEPQIPALSPLGLPYPNPFRETCRIPVSLKEPSELKLSVFNLKGQKVKDIQTTALTKGEHLIAWDGKDKNGKTLANGVYILRLQTREGVFTQRAVLLK